MQPVYYDLHIHTALSPCAENDMTPCDIVGMAILNGLDVIAITDHNSIANVKAACEAAKAANVRYEMEKELVVISGIEVTTAEEVHVLCLFENFDTAQSFESELCAFYSPLKNRADIFGEQLIYGSDDSVLGVMERMLAAPTTITFDGLFHLTQKYGGAFVPAHVDRGSFSVMSNLGFLPPDLDIAAVQFTSGELFGKSPDHDGSLFPDKKHIFSSDAHQLHTISEKNHCIMLPELSAKAVIDYLRH